MFGQTLKHPYQILSKNKKKFFLKTPKKQQHGPFKRGDFTISYTLTRIQKRKMNKKLTVAQDSSGVFAVTA